MRNLKLVSIWICLKISTNLVFKISTEFKKDGINIDFKLRDWCKNAI